VSGDAVALASHRDLVRCCATCSRTRSAIAAGRARAEPSPTTVPTSYRCRRWFGIARRAQQIHAVLRGRPSPRSAPRRPGLTIARGIARAYGDVVLDAAPRRAQARVTLPFASDAPRVVVRPIYDRAGELTRGAGAPRPADRDQRTGHHRAATPARRSRRDVTGFVTGRIDVGTPRGWPKCRGRGRML
jgi:hypothetical protein